MFLPKRYGRRRAAQTAGVALTASLLCGSAMAGSTGFALTGDNQLLRFDTDTPATVAATTSVSGLEESEDLLGIDFRPSAPGQLYGLSSFGRLYTINTSTGAATAVGPAATPDALPLLGRSFGVDFNPVPDAIRVVSDLGENFRLNPNTGAVLGIDGELMYAAGDTSADLPSDITAAAYTNNDVDPVTATTLYGIDSTAGNLVIQNPPNDGTLATVGSLGLNADLAQLIAGFDILGTDNRAFALSSGEAPDFGDATPATLYAINLQTGAATALGLLGDGSYTISGLALSDQVGPGPGPNPIPLPPAVFAFPIAAAVAGMGYRRMRRNGVNA